MGLTAIHKCATDGLSRYTRTVGAYDATTAAFVGEIVKVPVLALAVLAFEGRSRFWPVLRCVVRDQPFELMLPGLAYSIQNILYFQALSHVSVATYQILSQSKLVFTALFMITILQRKLTMKQLWALALLLFGTILTQWSEVPQSAKIGGSPLYGGFLVVLGALLSAWPNVYYEKVLKTESKEQWAKNIQLTFWIWFWLLVVSLRSLPQALSSMSSGTLLTGFTGLVWVVILLQSFKCILIPATLKWGDNIIYAYAKPLSILLTVTVTTLLLKGTSLLFCVGVAFVLLSMRLYGA